MMKLLDADGAWIAIGMSVFFVVVGWAMKWVFVSVLKNGSAEPLGAPGESPIRHD